MTYCKGTKALQYPLFYHITYHAISIMLIRYLHYTRQIEIADIIVILKVIRA